MRINTEDIKQLFKEANATDNSKIISFASGTDEIHYSSLLQNLDSFSVKYFYTSTPEAGLKFLGIESILDINETGERRVQNTSEKISSLNIKHYNNFDKFGLQSMPLFLGGMKFSPNESDDLWNEYSDSEWFIPRILFITIATNSYIILNFSNETFSEQDVNNSINLVEKLISSSASQKTNLNCSILSSNYDDTLERMLWMQQVTKALDQINKGKFHKIVLSRQVHLQLSCKPHFSALFEKLENDFPRCYIFAFRKNDSTFFGASPEKLAKISSGWVEADALAGSIRRGETPEEDESLANELLNSQKNLNEQRAVVEFIKSSFEEFAEEINFSEKPVIRKLPNIQHLWTPIRAKLKGNKSVLSLLKDIHPTPAICGVPWTNALVSIKEMEKHSRGLFAGMVGWFNLENEGEFVVAIRSALAKENNIYALAGCGIVEGSDPENEYREAELKLKPILSLFSHEEIYQS